MHGNAHSSARVITPSPEPLGPYAPPLLPTLGRLLPVPDAHPEARVLGPGVQCVLFRNGGHYQFG